MSAPTRPPASRPWSWPLGVAFVLFGVVSISGPLFLWQPQAQKPWTLPELAEHIHTTHPELQIIAAARTEDLAAGFFVSKRTISWEETVSLTTRIRADQRCLWRNVAFCKPIIPKRLDRDGMLREDQEWGEGGLLLGDIRIIGDPIIVTLIEALAQ
jgi:hypothetical protein